MLRSRYFERLGFSPDAADALSTPSKVNLDKIIEAHLDRIPFENLSQHGLPMPATLDIEKTAVKVLDKGRGGFCLELNALFADFLTELGYIAKRVPAFVNAPGVGFRDLATHLLLVVLVPDSDEGELLVDVGFGESAVNSLKYELDTTQSTPEGMECRLVRCSDDKNSVHLEWRMAGEWSPRLKWEYAHPGQSLEAFQPVLDWTLTETSIFHQKLVVCRISRTEKVTLAGSRLKRTSPRFGLDSKATMEHLETVEAIKKVLVEVFNLPDAEGLDIGKSVQATPEVFSHL
jgi:N-hydroxyarylamine O-acetyltransferase